MAKDRGWMTLLGQIDPGPEEGRLVEELRQRHAGWQCTRVAPPAGYYESWREETELADRVIVNSEWTAAALRRQGVATEKIVRIPIPYEADDTSDPKSAPPGGFGPQRPLRVLFLGQVNLRKGICELLEAMDLLRGEAVELSIVGAPQVTVPPELRALPGLRWIGSVPRSETLSHFRHADVFILPTHSDGFGLTQLEALAHRVPVIVSENCARLVHDDVQGRVLPEVSPTAIADVLRSILANPDLLTRWSAACAVPEECRIESVTARMRGVLASL
jgi:glycosyltransferase involved in cell wall biosynthesis